MCSMCNLRQCKATSKGAEIVIQIHNLIAHMEMLPSLSDPSAMKFWQANYPKTLQDSKLISITSISSKNILCLISSQYFYQLEAMLYFGGHKKEAAKF